MSTKARDKAAAHEVADALLTALKRINLSREVSLTIAKAEEAKMWLDRAG